MKFSYVFKLASGPELRFDFRLDPSTLAFLDSPPEPLPEWTALEHNQCPNCPLQVASSPRCPVARNLAPIIERFKDSISYDQAEIAIRTEAREYRKTTALQDGISAMIGIVMATSGCPILDKLRPMVRTHLPFAEHEETTYRSLSMYLLAQFLRRRKGLAADWDLERFVAVYDAITTVNQAFVLRLRSIQIQDASLNALVHLDCFANITQDSALRRSLPELEELFAPYLQPDDAATPENKPPAPR